MNLNIFSYVEGGAAEPRYLPEIKEFSKSERNTLLVNFADVYDFNKTLSDNIQTNFFRLIFIVLF